MAAGLLTRPGEVFPLGIDGARLDVDKGAARPAGPEDVMPATNSIFKLVAPALMALALCFTAGCGPGYLDIGERVEATDENRAVFNVLKAYHKAMEDRDIETLKKMVSKRYYENGGTTDSDKDDYGIDKLNKGVLQKLRDNVRRVQFRIKLLDIEVKGENAQAQYEFFGRVLLTEGGRDNYKMWNDFAQMDLVMEDGRWKILRGL